MSDKPDISAPTARQELRKGACTDSARTESKGQMYGQSVCTKDDNGIVLSHTKIMALANY